MAGLQPLISQIYHEKQQDGSMLCAQHALNSLLQGNYFTAPDLSAIAARLDDLEGTLGTEDERNKESANMDDTGFFSIQVMEEALQLWGLRMVHWRSPEMQSHQSNPNRQFAFILNLEQHWFTVRRFGLAEEPENVTAEEADKSHWFNLNSFLDRPELIGKLYLGMILQQAETEGYSVYAILRIDQETPLPMLKTPADEIASTLPQPVSFADTGSHLSTDRMPRQRAGPSTAVNEFSHIEGLEDEDMELQAALQASLAGADLDQVTIPTGPPIQASSSSAPRSVFAEAMSTDENDPVASSMARSRALMDQMRRHQEAALRENYLDEVEGNMFPSMNRFAGLAEGAGLGQQPQPQPGLVRRKTRGEEEEEEAIRQALEASRAEGSGEGDDEDGDQADEEMVPPPPTSAPNPAPNTERFGHHTGVYDDDDADLQAALKASLEDMPEGGPTIPRPESIIPRQTPTAATSSTSVRVPPPRVADDEDEEYVEEEEEEEAKTVAPPVTESVDVDEMRKRRLARFGGT